MKHLKKFENSKGINYITLNLGDYITIKSIKSDKYLDKKTIERYGEEYSYLGTVKDISIFLNGEYIAKLILDERKYNVIYEDYNKTIFSYKYKKECYKLIKDLLYSCHNLMKKSNKNYGTYGDTGHHSYEYEGKISLLVHHFFDFIKDYYDNSKSIEAIKLKEFQKNLDLYLNTEKYNL